MTAILIDILLGLAVVSAWLGTAGLVLLRTSEDRLHAATFTTVAPGFLITVAVLLHQPFSALSLKQVLLFAASVVLGGILTHSIGRMLRIRDESTDRA
ncbi:multicomponent Na+:H+ antiporter subunit G [Faunimonas pinastri]|uniref:Multicomponent Na+:H+ antiporter subunit G n=1 Tax=Faunimonas pinastri TaxID=1855383 RepID=A0A1H9LG65_9HYPH|nr:monovalent cation/H(+) antiporter subunit G [Faunimonas pinastri]SER10370.1 multicomponent Na+:H+ antiporter subunit G [Faunimonas pinastri]